MHDDPSDPEGALAIAEHFHGEWYNGGFAQFFANWEPEDAALVPAALRALEFSQGADLVEKAIAAMGPPDKWRSIGHQALMNRDLPIAKRLYAIDREFDQFEKDLVKAITDFESQHAKKFDEEIFE